MATKREITVTVNGQQYHSQVEPRLLLVHYLRDVLDLTGTHIGCDTSQCGACTVLINGESAKACTVLAVQADGSEVTTIEGLAPEGSLHPIQEGFWEKHGLQCGFCSRKADRAALCADRNLTTAPAPRFILTFRDRVPS